MLVNYSYTYKEHIQLQCLSKKLVPILSYRVVSNKRSPSNKRPLTYSQTKLGKMPKFLYGVSL